MFKKPAVIKTTLSLPLFLFCSFSYSQVWVDSASVSVSDGSVIHDRDHRGGVLADSPVVGFDVSDIVVLPSDVSKAITDLSSVFGDREEIVANCIIPEVTVELHECPVTDDNSCYRPMTHESWLNVDDGADGSLHIRKLIGLVSDSDGNPVLSFEPYNQIGLQYLFYNIYPDYSSATLGEVDDSVNVDGPGDFDDPLITRSLTIPESTISITLSKLNGYGVTFKDNPILSREWIGGGLDHMQGIYGDYVSLVETQIASHPRILKPKVNIVLMPYECFTSLSCGDQAPLDSFTTTMSYLGAGDQRISEKEGIRALMGHGTLAERLGIHSMRHIQAAGSYQPYVQMSIETAWLLSENNVSSTFYTGSDRVGQPVVTIAGGGLGNYFPFTDEITTMEVSNAVPTSPSTTPFKHNLTCTFQ